MEQMGQARLSWCWRSTLWQSFAVKIQKQVLNRCLSVEVTDLLLQCNTAQLLIIPKKSNGRETCLPDHP